MKHCETMESASTSSNSKYIYPKTGLDTDDWGLRTTFEVLCVPGGESVFKFNFHYSNITFEIESTRVRY